MTISAEDMELLVEGRHPDPFAVLGPHGNGKGGAIEVRAFLPGARRAEVLDPDGERTEMSRVRDEGLFVAERRSVGSPYRLSAEWEGGAAIFEDAYQFASRLGELDLHLMGEGRDLRLYDKLGAQHVEVDGVPGVYFTVWAPNARRVSVVGDFNGWDGRRLPMRLHPGVGVWEVFVPRLPDGTVYKYEILPPDGPPFLKADPFAFQAELRPATGSRVHKRGRYRWGDDAWMKDPERGALDRPMSVYEVHLGSWRHADGEPLDYREMAHRLADYVREMGFTHVELLPVAEHPYDPSWGYQVTGYFAPTSRFGSPDDFRYLVDHMHQSGIGVILDWVPAHFPRDEAGLRRFDGTALYEHADPRQGEHPDWGTLVFNYGRAEVRNFLISNALYWLNEFHIDGLRVDAVASMLYLDYSREPGQWIPNRYGGRENLEAIDFLRELNTTVRNEVPGAMMIAEESTSWPGVTRPPEEDGLGFTLKWNMGWMNDSLRFISHEAVHRKYHFNLLTFSLVYAFSERFVLPISHDEVVHGKRSLIGKMPGDDWQKAANLRLYLGFMWGHPGKNLLFMGSEFGQWEEWSEARSLDWHLLEDGRHAGIRSFVRDLNRIYREHPPLWEADDDPNGFEWIDFNDHEQSVVSFIRRAPSTGEILVIVCNFTPVAREGYRIGVPHGGEYDEVLNSDSAHYGGGNVGNQGSVRAAPEPAHERDWSLRLTLAPLSVQIFRPRND